MSGLDGVGGRAAIRHVTATGVVSDLLLAPIADQNTALSTFTFTPAAAFAGTARIVFEIDDQGNTGVGGELSRTRFIDITVAAPGDAEPAVNNQPDVTLPGGLVTAVDTPVVFSPTVSDIDAGSGPTELEIEHLRSRRCRWPIAYPPVTTAPSPGDLRRTTVTSDISVTPLATRTEH